MHHININGKIMDASKAALPIDNGASRYGYGLFETMLVQNGQIMMETYHMERLFAGMAGLSLRLPTLTDPEKIVDNILATVHKNNLQQLCRVRLQVYAGGGGLYGQDVSKAGYFIECFNLNEDAIAYNENGLQAGIAKGINKSNDTLANLKTCNALVYAIAARQARENKWNDALVYNTAGNIIESTIANIFWVKDSRIFTPPLSEGCIAGVLRRHITEHTTISERPLSYDTLMQADEVFLTNAIKRIKWVAQIDDKQYHHTVSRRLAVQLFTA